MNTHNPNDARLSGQDAAGSAQSETERLAKALGSSTVERVEHKSPHELLAWHQARQHQRAQLVIPFDNPDLMRGDLLRYIQGLKAEEISVAYRNTPSVGDDGEKFLQVTPAVLGFVKISLADALKEGVYSATQSYPGASKGFTISNIVLDQDGNPVCTVKLDVSGITKEISIWLHPLR